MGSIILSFLFYLYLSYGVSSCPQSSFVIVSLFNMPIDINLLRVSRGGNPDLVRQSQRNRYASVELVDEVIELDDVDFLDVDYCRNGEL